MIRTIFPSIASILSPEALIQDVLPGYAIGNVTNCQLFSSGFNHTYRVQTEVGKTYYLRAYRRAWRTQEDILYELDVLNHLKHKDFPAIRPLQYQDGKDYVSVPAPEGLRILVLFNEAPGRDLSYVEEPEKMSHIYGQAVAGLHNALDDFDSQHARFRLDLANFIDQPIRYIEPFLVQRPDDWVYVLHFADTLRQRLEQIPENRLERGFCHGDLQGYHAKKGSDGVLTFFDFDCGGFGYRAYDLAVFLWCCRLEDAVEARWDVFLTAYRGSRSISDLDVQAVPLFVCARYLWHMGVHAQNSYDWGIEFLNDGYYDTHLKRLRDAEAEYLS